MIRAVIIDDEPAAVEILASLVSRHCPEVNILGSAGDVEEGIQLIRGNDPELIFLDIQLREGNGFDLLRKLDKQQCKIIFITAFEEYAITAFKFSAVDYILKPVNPKELSSAVNKAIHSLEADSISRRFEVMFENLDPHSKNARKIVLRTATNLHIVDVQNIIRCQSDRNYTQFFLVDGMMISVAKTLKEYEELLSGFRFIRVHQSHLININHIRRYEKSNGGFIVLSDETRIPVSFRKKEDFMRLIGQIQH